MEASLTSVKEATDSAVSMGTQRTVLFLVSPLAVGAAMLLAWVVLIGWGWSGHTPELLAGGVLNIVAGTLAVLPTAVLLRHGAARLALGALAATVIRTVVDLAGTLLLLAPGWALERYWLLGFVTAFYLVLLLAETTVTAWVVRRAK